MKHQITAQVIAGEKRQVKNMEKFQVVEHFISINGEGRRAGQLAVFIRFAGCNLSCEYCDTKWANAPETEYESYTAPELYQMIKRSGVRNVTLTGGEPLLQKNMNQLLSLLRQDKELQIEIETNGSVDIAPFMAERNAVRTVEEESREDGRGEDNVTFTLDYKLSASGMEERMCLSNYSGLRSIDTVKFVAGSRADLVKSKEIIDRYGLVEKGCGIYLSPCFGKIEPREIVDFLVEQNMNGVNVQLQLHKYIWNPEQRGV